MTYLIAVIIAALLFAGFLALTAYEARRGSRLFAGKRYLLDTKVARMFFVIEHVDWGAFSAHLTRTTATTLAHDIAHGTLVAVRAIERFLTQAVRALRSHRDNAATLPEAVAPTDVVMQVQEETPKLSKTAEPEVLKVVSEGTHDTRTNSGVRTKKRVRQGAVVVEDATSPSGAGASAPEVVQAEVREAPVPSTASASAAPQVPAPQSTVTAPARRAPRRSMDIPRRTKSKGHDIVQEPNKDTPV